MAGLEAVGFRVLARPTLGAVELQVEGAGALPAFSSLVLALAGAAERSGRRLAAAEQMEAGGGSPKGGVS